MDLPLQSGGVKLIAPVWLSKSIKTTKSFNIGELMEEKKKEKIWIFALVALILLLLVSSLYWYMPERKGEEEKEREVDNRISPMENQAIFVQVLRIRNRGLMERMLSYGNSWKETPSFYYTITVDDEFGSAKGNVGEEGVYNTWDTMGYESTMTFDVDEEREYSDITISIFEIQPKGFFGEEEVEKERISLKYDYRTGRWTGDDSLGDRDGLGHYLGENYEIWFNIYQADYDHDGIPYWTEVNVLGTDPAIDDSNLDPDGDGIPTVWEWRYGYDPFTYNDHKNLDPDIDGIENIEEYQMRKYFANPFQPDIYIETDGMERRGIIDLPHIFYKESQQMIIERFAQHGINVYIDDGWSDSPPNGGGELLPYHNNLDDVLGKELLAFYTHHFPDDRKGIFRYVVVGARKDGGGFITPVNYNHFDAIYVSNDLNSMKVRLAFTPREIRVMLAKAILHEMGHSIGLMPVVFPGIDIMSRKVVDRYPSMSDEDYKGYLDNYYSVMNYQYIYNKPWFFSAGTHEYLFDYSDGSNGEPYDMNDWAHIYLPTFQIDVPSYEEPSDENFEDFEIVDDYPGVVASGWKFDSNLTERYSDKLKNLAVIKNADVDIQVFVNEDGNDGYDVRIYAKPFVEPVYSIYSLVAEGKKEEGKIKFYSQQEIIDSVMEKRK